MRVMNYICFYYGNDNTIFIVIESIQKHFEIKKDKLLCNGLPSEQS